MKEKHLNVSPDPASTSEMWTYAYKTNKYNFIFVKPIRKDDFFLLLFLFFNILED